MPGSAGWLCGWERDETQRAALVGAALGALYGKNGIPSRWISDLPSRAMAQEDDDVFSLLSAARQRWWP